MYTFLVTVKKNSITEYWSRDPMFATPFFATLFSQDCFLILLLWLHFINNATAILNDPLYKKNKMLTAGSKVPWQTRRPCPLHCPYSNHVGHREGGPPDGREKQTRQGDIKPDCVLDYNLKMGEVDKADMINSFVECTKLWYDQVVWEDVFSRVASKYNKPILLWCN